jgi:glutamate formiminotransferase
VLRALKAACGVALLDEHHDADHNRSVFTLAGGDVEPAVQALARVAVEQIDLRDHDGVHPRLGVVDVVPFVPLAGSVMDDAVAAARRTAAWVGAELGVPAFLYGAADDEARTLPALRSAAFTTRAPDFGPDRPHPTAGAVAVGARPPLVAVNCVLAPDATAALAREIARALRERDGGLPGVRALAFPLASAGRLQVSMNLTDLAATGIEAACSAVRRHAHEGGSDVAAVELVGLVPVAELDRCTPEFVAWAGLRPDQTIEARLRKAGVG